MPKMVTEQLSWPIVGHRNVVNFLQRSLGNPVAAQAYIFVGPAHIGKATVAKHFINALIPGVVDITEKDNVAGHTFHPDVYWLDREVNAKTEKLKKNISIEQIRLLQNKLSLRSFLNTYKICVISQAQHLSTEAANSLLKTLEEPNAKTILILLAEHLNGLPPTIVSRCQILRFLPVATQDIFDHLLSLKIERKKAKNLAQLAFGRPGVATSLAAESQRYADYLSAAKAFLTLLKADINDKFKVAGELAKTNDTDGLSQVLDSWAAVLRDLLVMNYWSANAVAHLSLAADLEKVASVYRRDQLLHIFLKLKQTKIFLRANVNPKLALENLVLNF